MLLIILFRVHTEFWTQNSRLLPDVFPIHESISPDSRLSNRSSIETFEKTQEPSFFYGALQTYCNHGAMGTKTIMKVLILWLNVLATGEIELTTGKKFTDQALFVAIKKLQTLNYFSRLYLHFQDFFHVLEIKTFSRIHDSAWTLFFSQYMYARFQWFLNDLRQNDL